MTPGRRPALLVVTSAIVCFVASATTKGGPLFLLEAVGSLVVVAWAAFALVLIGRSAVLARKLGGRSVPRRFGGVDCRVVPDNQPHAFVAGVLYPSVFLTTGALGVLTRDELQASSPCDTTGSQGAWVSDAPRSRVRPSLQQLVTGAARPATDTG